jgi:hypothetical protein
MWKDLLTKYGCPSCGSEDVTINLFGYPMLPVFENNDLHDEQSRSLEPAALRSSQAGSRSSRHAAPRGRFRRSGTHPEVWPRRSMHRGTSMKITAAC